MSRTASKQGEWTAWAFFILSMLPPIALTLLDYDWKTTVITDLMRQSNAPEDLGYFGYMPFWLPLLIFEMVFISIYWEKNRVQILTTSRSDSCYSICISYYLLIFLLSRFRGIYIPIVQRIRFFIHNL